MSDQENNLILYERELKTKSAALIVLDSIKKTTVGVDDGGQLICSDDGELVLI